MSDCPGVETTNAWAVGYYYNSAAAANRTLTMRFNGTSWNVVPSTGSNELENVDAISASDVWGSRSHASSTTSARSAYIAATSSAANPRARVGGHGKRVALGAGQVSVRYEMA